MVSGPSPTGTCWCGCGGQPKGGFFLSGHDTRAGSNVIAVEYGSVAQFLTEHGYGPGGKNSLEARESMKRRRDTG